MKDIISLHVTCDDDKLIKGENPGDTYLLYVLQCHLGSFWLCFWYPDGSLDHLVALDTKEVQGPVNKHDPCKIYHLINLCYHQRQTRKVIEQVYFDL